MRRALGKCSVVDMDGIEGIERVGVGFGVNDFEEVGRAAFVRAFRFETDTDRALLSSFFNIFGTGIEK